MINRPVFPVRTPEGFYEQLLASKPDSSIPLAMNLAPAGWPL